MKFRRTTVAVSLVVAAFLRPTVVQAGVTDDFVPIVDSLCAMMNGRTGVEVELVVKKVLSRGRNLDFYFSRTLTDYPWSREDVEFLRTRLRELFPEKYASRVLGGIYCEQDRLESVLETCHSAPVGRGGVPLVTRIGARSYEEGLSGRNIALWQSHGRYFNDNRGLWEWQRPPLFRTREDLYTQTYVLPFLIPMLENAGACVLTPRERDTQTREVICDNDPSFRDSGHGAALGEDTADAENVCLLCDSASGDPEESLRKAGTYREEGAWSDAGVGFADTKAYYLLDENPFTTGSSRMAPVLPDGGGRAVWTARFDSPGSFAVYISYRSLPGSTTAAHYTVNHAAGSTEFLVNQRIGGGTWIYLGTFDFDGEGSVVLDNKPYTSMVSDKGIVTATGPDGDVRDGHDHPETPAGLYASGSAEAESQGSAAFSASAGKTKSVNGGRMVVTADAVRFGGGMGKYARSGSDEEDPVTSGLPAYTEGALYSMMWSGFGTDVTTDERWTDEYTRDYASRGAWVSHLVGGSASAPEQKGLGIPVDLSLGFHTDAGTHQCDSTVGTLAIYSRRNEGKTTLPDGRSRQTCRELAQIVQDNVVGDIRALYNPDWNRRQLWNRNYSESRSTSVPGMLLELLSHANFADMKYGMDPMFRFSVSRAVYKGVLKYLSYLYGIPYTVQPLPVRSFAAGLADDGCTALLSWRETVDSLEASARAEGFVMYTRRGDGCFDQGYQLHDVSCKDGVYSVRVPLRKGVLYSFRIVAWNKGGSSLPSETLCVGIPAGGAAATEASSQRVLIVNNFDRVSAPAWFETGEYAGFDGRMDSGVPWGTELGYIGEDYEHRRDRQYVSDDEPGFGASYSTEECSVIPGNNFDLVHIHAMALMSCGYTVTSSSCQAWTSDHSLSEGTLAVDLLCGKQVSTVTGRSDAPVHYRVWPAELQSAITEYTAGGGNIIVSGADIATDIWETVYPLEQDPMYVSTAGSFVRRTLGFTGHSYFERSGRVRPQRNSRLRFDEVAFPVNYNNVLGGQPYCVDNADALSPAGRRSTVILRYAGTGNCAAVAYDPGPYRVVSFGFPLETITDSTDLSRLLSATLAWFR